MDNADLAYDLKVPCCGETLHVRRSNELARRIEQAAGPIYPLSLKLRTLAVTSEEVAGLIHALVKDVRGAPGIAAIRAWLYDVGLPKVAPELSGEVLTLISGNDAVAKYQAAAEASSAEARGEDGPFARTAG
jgi:hypothetical protein